MTLAHLMDHYVTLVSVFDMSNITNVFKHLCVVYLLQHQNVLLFFCVFWCC